MAARRNAVLLFAVWFVLSSLPIVPPGVSAAPPETELADTRSVPGQVKDADGLREPAPRVALAADSPRGEAANGQDVAPAPDHADAGSVRPRGLEAPVQLRQRAADPLDGQAEDDAEERRETLPEAKSRSRKANKRERPEPGIRVWPMRAERYSFSQAFGCVPQIAHFYQPGAGCPASAPVIHHGIDMAAPEGTPFYAAASGWVTEAGYDREVGVANTRIIIQHDDRNEDYATEYLHWIASFVDVGDYVEAGEAIGEVGSVGYSTGPHLHFSIIDLKNGGNLDPVRWLPNEKGFEGHYGRLPNERAEMRLPPGTTAGVPEWHDPAPPPPPEREEIPESPPDRDRSDRKRKKDRKERKERRAEKGDAPANAGADRDDVSANADDPDANTDETKAKGKGKEKDTDRTRKRERDKSGKEREKSASGQNGDAKLDEKKREKSTAKDDNRGDHKSPRNDKKKDTVDQRGSNGGEDRDKDKNKNRHKHDDTKRDDSEADEPVQSNENPDDDGTGNDSGTDEENGGVDQQQAGESEPGGEPRDRFREGDNGQDLSDEGNDRRGGNENPSGDEASSEQHARQERRGDRADASTDADTGVDQDDVTEDAGASPKRRRNREA